MWYTVQRIQPSPPPGTPAGPTPPQPSWTLKIGILYFNLMHLLSCGLLQQSEGEVDGLHLEVGQDDDGVGEGTGLDPS